MLKNSKYSSSSKHDNFIKRKNGKRDKNEYLIGRNPLKEVESFDTGKFIKLNNMEDQVRYVEKTKFINWGNIAG